MKSAFIFKQDTWLIETIRKFKKIKFRELSRKWKETEMSGGFPLSRTTFNRQRDNILDMFGLVIDCEQRGGNNYFIFNENVLQKESVQNWLYSSLSIGLMLTERKRLFGRILLERIPSADSRLKAIVHAMYESRQVKMTYQRYEASGAKDFTASPYCLKLFNRRWYVVMAVPSMSTGEQRLTVFSLDRIIGIELLDGRFTLPENFDAESFFSECFGVVVGDGTKPERIRLRAFGRERFGLQDLPIHHSQRIICQTDDYTDFELFLRPTADFKAFLLSKGKWLIVKEPYSLAEEIKALHGESVEEYDKIT